MGETLLHILFMHLLKSVCVCVYIYAQTKKAYKKIYIYMILYSISTNTQKATSYRLLRMCLVS